MHSLLFGGWLKQTRYSSNVQINYSESGGGGGGGLLAFNSGTQETLQIEFACRRRDAKVLEKTIRRKTEGLENP